MRLWSYAPKKKKSKTSSGGSMTSAPVATPTVTQIVLAPTPSPVSSCADALPAAQALSVVCCYDSNGFKDLTGNDHGMFAHATATGNFWHTASLASGSGSGPYPVATPTRTWYLLEPVQGSCTLQEGNPIALPTGLTANFQSTQTPQGGTCGKSDERCYMLTLSEITPNIVISGSSGGTFANITAYFGAATGVTFFTFYTGGGHTGVVTNAWLKHHDHIYAVGNTGGFGPPNYVLASFPVPSPNGTVQDAQMALSNVIPSWSNSFDPLTSILMMHATASFIYILVSAAWDGGATEVRLVKVNRATLRYVSHWNLASDPNFQTPWGIHCFNDDLVFLVQAGFGGNPWKFGYLQTSTSTTTVIGTVAQQCTNAGSGVPGQNGFYYAKNHFYLSSSGSGSGVTNVLKIGQLMCPSNADIPWEDF